MKLMRRTHRTGRKFQLILSSIRYMKTLGRWLKLIKT